MARGWESKHVEDQQEQARERREPPAVREPGALDERRALELALADLRSRLGRARTSAQRESVQRTITELEARLSL